MCMLEELQLLTPKEAGQVDGASALNLRPTAALMLSNLPVLLPILFCCNVCLYRHGAKLARARVVHVAAVEAALLPPWVLQECHLQRQLLGTYVWCKIHV